MYIKELRLENVRCFKEARLDFTRDDGSPILWNVLLGKNGTGKSTILRSIGCILADRPMPSLVGPEYPQMLRVDAESAKAQVKLGPDSEDHELVTGFHFSKTQALSDTPEVWQYFLESSEDYELQKEMNNALRAVGYGPTRMLPPDDKSREASKRFRQHGIIAALMPLFDEGAWLLRPDDWLRDLEYAAFKLEEDNDPSGRERFRKAGRILSEALPDVEFREIDKLGRVLFDTPFGTVTFDQLSYGYKDTAAWIADLARWFFEFYPDSESPLEEPAIVLIEELALHLHPVWQQKLVGYLRSLFPKTQFIATTHSPLLAQSLDRGELITLIEEPAADNGLSVVRAERSELVPKAMNLNEILTSPLFEAPTAKSLEVLHNELEFYQLKRKAHHEGLRPEDEQRYDSLLKYFEDVPTTPAETYDERTELQRIREMLQELGGQDLFDKTPLNDLEQPDAGPDKE
jgi:energy-coupling factor transporter ATP-binding protein EcfA2